MSNFKKLAVATAIAAVGSTSAFAINVGEPGAALLVPTAIFSSADQMNTLVGITKLNTTGQVGVDGRTGAGYLTEAVVAGPSNNLHWYFFNARSVHQLDGALAVTDQGFVGFDLGAQIVVADGGVGGTHDGMPGYLVFVDNAQFTSGGTAGSAVNLYGDAAIVTGNWGSAAFVPVMPLADTGAAAIAATNHVTYAANGIPTRVTPVTAGVALADQPGADATVNATFNMRYFVESLGLGGNATTDLVVWFDHNSAARTNLPVNIYDTNQVANSANINLPDEMNVVNAGALPWVASKGAGHVEITVPSAAATGSDIWTSAVAFSLVSFGPAATDGVQTILAHERGVQ